MQDLFDMALVEELRDLAAGEPEFLEGLLREFILCSQRELAELQALTTATPPDSQAIKIILHNLQGRCANMGMKALAARLRVLGEMTDPLNVPMLEAGFQKSIAKWALVCQISQ